MGKKSATVGGIGIDWINAHKSLQQYGDSLAVIPDRYRLLMKTFGPLYTTYLKAEMGIKSVSQAFGENKESIEELSEASEEGEEAVKSSFTSMISVTGILTATFKPLGKVLGGVKKLFKGILMGILPLIGIMFMMMGAVMLLVAVFDKGGGSLRAWLEDLPLIGTAFGIVQGAVDKVKDAISGVEWDTVKGKMDEIGGAISDTFGPVLGDALEQAKGRFTTIAGQLQGTWNNIKANLTLEGTGISWEEFFGAGATGLQTLVDFYFQMHTMIFDSLIEIVNYFAEEGFFQRIVDSVMGIWTSLQGAFDDISSALGEAGTSFGGIMDFIKTVWDGFIGFLFESGIFEFLVEIVEMFFEFYQTVIYIVGKLTAIIIKYIAWIYPYVKPYFLMLWNAVKIIIVLVLAVLRTVRNVARGIMAIIRGDTDKAKEIFSSIGDIWRKTFDNIEGYFGDLIDNLLAFIKPLTDKVEWMLDALDKLDIGGKISGGIDAVAGAFSFAGGGIARGPKGGYMAMLHGSEAVIPLPDGRTIPVTIAGGDQGGGITININVSGVGDDPRKIARMIGEEVGRVFKNRSRGSGFSRGVG